MGWGAEVGQARSSGNAGPTCRSGGQIQWRQLVHLRAHLLPGSGTLLPQCRSSRVGRRQRDRSGARQAEGSPPGVHHHQPPTGFHGPHCRSGWPIRRTPSGQQLTPHRCRSTLPRHACPHGERRPDAAHSKRDAYCACFLGSGRLRTCSSILDAPAMCSPTN